MFLLPAIGAWISDSLVLYIYFTEGRHNATNHPANGAGNLATNFAPCSSSINPCQHFEPSVPHKAINKNTTISSFPDATSYETLGTEKSMPVSNYEQQQHSSSSSYLLEQQLRDEQDIPSSFAPKDEPYPNNDEYNNDEYDDRVGISAATIESKTRYLSILAIIRLILLTFPLSYAAYSGTRVPCVIAQYLFHGISSMIVVSHMLAVLIVEPTNTFGPPVDTKEKGEEEPVLPVDDNNDETDNSSNGYSGDAWTLLSLSLVSILLHFLIVLHVRSTGPIQDGLYEEKRKRKRLAYAMAARSSSAMGGGNDTNGGHDNMNGQHHNSSDDEEIADADESFSPLLLPNGDNNKDHTRIISFKEKLMCLPDQYEAFVSDTQARFDAARRMWSDRLEIMTQSNNNNNNSSSNGSSSNGSSTHGDGVVVPSNSRDVAGALQQQQQQQQQQSPPQRNLESSNLLTHAITNVASNATKLVPLKPDPFRVLLQLFAYEDVWSGTHNKLDLAFAAPGQSNDKDFVYGEGSAALSFYAPQLLSFLLHGAYFDISSKLEEWILTKCGQDLHFAHRCFWFLRSWCLGGSSGGTQSRLPSHAHSLSSSSGGALVGGLDILALGPEAGSQYATGVNKLRGVETNLYLSSYHQGGLVPESPYHHTTLSLTDPPGWDSYSGADGFGESTTSRFSPDEQVLIEQLLHRVVEQGIRPATAAQYGSIDGGATDDYNSNDGSNGFAGSPSALATAVEQGLVPVDPRTGFHSTAHLDCITSVHKHGFLPLSNTGEPYQKSGAVNNASSLFFAAPIFLDALLSVADDLMNVSRSSRTVELRKRLRSLEVELLPSNVVYLPIQNMQHRVWRVVSDESIALSTNERVPCIITLEVIDCGVDPDLKEQQPNRMANTDDAITSSWVRTPRAPQRHSTLIDKMANYTQEGLRRLEDTFDNFSAHGDGKSGVLERRFADFIAGQKEAWKKPEPMYTAVGSADEDDQYTDHDGEESEMSELGNLPSQHSTKDEDDLIAQFVPPPPLGAPLPSDNIEAPVTPKSPPPTKGPSSPMGQWSTPKKKDYLKLRKRNLNAIENITEEDSTDEELSPQQKQRKRAIFPPLLASMTRSEPSSPVDISLDPEVIDTLNDSSTPSTVAPAVVFKEDWKTKTERLRKQSIYGSHPGWRLLPILIKSNDDLRQEQLASQLIQRMALILAKARVPVWLYPYEIVSLTGRGGIIECVPE